MDSFLEKYVQLSNKNQKIIISTGQKQNEYVFNNTIDKKKIHRIIQFINATYKFKKKYYVETVYQKGNEQIKRIENEITYIIIKDVDLYMDDDYLLKWRKYKSDTVVVPSHDAYDNVCTKEILEFLIENSFICKVIIIDGLHSLEITVNKPCDKNKVLDFLKKIAAI